MKQGVWGFGNWDKIIKKKQITATLFSFYEQRHWHLSNIFIIFFIKE